MSEPLTRVLLVEDDERDYLMTRELLAESAGEQFALHRAARLSAGIAAVSSGATDVVLLDLSLPDSQGWVTFERMRDHAPQVPIILLTGQEDEELALRAMKEGAQDYLYKGAITGHLLVRSIRYAIERNSVQLSLKHYQEHLEELVADRTTELSWTNEQLRGEVAERRAAENQLKQALHHLQEHDQAKSDFVSNVSHELKTPLASMNYAIENLLKGVVGPLPAPIRTYLAMMSEDCARLAGTVNDILDVSRIDAKRLTLNFARVPFARLVSHAVEPFKVQAHAKSLALTLLLSEETGFVLCDPQRMERVVSNLLSNAIKFTPDGGAIEVSASRRDGESPKVLLVVTDNGIGIPPEHLGRVSERYFRVGEHVSGTGLGLSLCKDLLEMHGGQLNVASPPPGLTRGTRVVAEMPATRAPSVVAVDPDPAALENLELQLAGHGYRITACRSNTEALEFMASRPPDAVILDSRDPSWEGLEMVGRIRANPEFERIPVIVTTAAYPDPTHCEMLRSLRIPSLRKPCSCLDLVGCLEKVIMAGNVTGNGHPAAVEGTP